MNRLFFSIVTPGIIDILGATIERKHAVQGYTWFIQVLYIQVLYIQVLYIKGVVYSRCCISKLLYKQGVVHPRCCTNEVAPQKCTRGSQKQG